MRMVCWSIGLHGINGRRETPDDDVSLEMEVHTNNTHHNNCPKYQKIISSHEDYQNISGSVGQSQSEVCRVSHS